MNNNLFEKSNYCKNKEKHYFASCNTPKGFVSFFSDIFNPESFEQVYILKGGPGVGKSTLLKTIGKEAAGRGMDVEYFHCSSSPASLDGIIINDLKIAMFDGTLPHNIEPTYPGIREIIINMGECWNIEKLKNHRDEVALLIKKKAAHYRKATNYLNACDSIKSEIFSLVRTMVIMPKLNDSVERVFKANFSKVPASAYKDNTQIRITSALCSDGKIYLDTFEKLAETNYFIKEFKETSFIYFEQLYNKAKSRDLKMYVSYCPQNPKHIDGLFFPDNKLSFTVLKPSDLERCEKQAKTYKIINMARFANSRLLKDKKQSLKFGEKCISELEGASFASLGEAAKTHEQIESIYMPCTNYKSVTKLTVQLTKKIFDKA